MQPANSLHRSKNAFILSHSSFCLNVPGLGDSNIWQCITADHPWIDRKSIQGLVSKRKRSPDNTVPIQEKKIQTERPILGNLFICLGSTFSFNPIDVSTGLSIHHSFGESLPQSSEAWTSLEVMARTRKARGRKHLQDLSCHGKAKKQQSVSPDDAEPRPCKADSWIPYLICLASTQDHLLDIESFEWCICVLYSQYHRAGT